MPSPAANTSTATLDVVDGVDVEDSSTVRVDDISFFFFFFGFRTTVGRVDRVHTTEERARDATRTALQQRGRGLSNEGQRRRQHVVGGQVPADGAGPDGLPQGALDAAR